MDVPVVTRERMLAENVSRASEMRGSSLAFLDMRMPAHERENINIIGLNVTENLADPALAPIIKAPAHGFRNAEAGSPMASCDHMTTHTPQVMVIQFRTLSIERWSTNSGGDLFELTTGLHCRRWTQIQV